MGLSLVSLALSLITTGTVGILFPALRSNPIYFLSSVAAVYWLLEGRKRRADAIASAVAKVLRDKTRSQRQNDYIAPYPNGWYKLSDSEDLRVGQVKEVTACGLLLALYRGEDGQARVMDVYCPHMGANLAVGSRVVGNCIECPFHMWQFDGCSGGCTKIPALGDAPIPTFLKAKTYIVKEYNDMIFFWFHSENQPPSYQPEPIKEIEDRTFRYGGRYKRLVAMHLQEFAENSPLHGRMCLPWTSIRVPFIDIVHKADWKKELSAGKEHMSFFYDSAYLTFRGKRIPRTDANAVITFTGPGSIVYFTFLTPLGKIILYQCHTPVEPLLQSVEFRWYSERSMPRILVWYIVGNWIAQWMNDIMIWEHKAFIRRPPLTSVDGPVNANRRWFAQFYSASGVAAKTKDEPERPEAK